MKKMISKEKYKKIDEGLKGLNQRIYKTIEDYLVEMKTDVRLFKFIPLLFEALMSKLKEAAGAGSTPLEAAIIYKCSRDASLLLGNVVDEMAKHKELFQDALDYIEKDYLRFQSETAIFGREN